MSEDPTPREPSETPPPVPGEPAADRAWPPRPPSLEPTMPGPPPEPSPEDRTLARLAHLLGIFTSFIACLIIWLVKKDESPFIDDQAKEALNFQITILILSIVSSLLTIVVIGCVLLPIVTVLAIVFPIIGAVESNKGVAYRYPICIRFIG